MSETSLEIRLIDVSPADREFFDAATGRTPRQPGSDADRDFRSPHRSSAEAQRDARNSAETVRQLDEMSRDMRKRTAESTQRVAADMDRRRAALDRSSAGSKLKDQTAGSTAAAGPDESRGLRGAMEDLVRRVIPDSLKAHARAASEWARHTRAGQAFFRRARSAADRLGPTARKIGRVAGDFTSRVATPAIRKGAANAIRKGAARFAATSVGRFGGGMAGKAVQRVAAGAATRVAGGAVGRAAAGAAGTAAAGTAAAGTTAGGAAATGGALTVAGGATLAAATGPVGIAAGAAAVALTGVATAAVVTGKGLLDLNRAATDLRDVNGTLGGILDRRAAIQDLNMVERGRRLAPHLAGFEEARTRLSDAQQEVWTKLLEQFAKALPVLETLADTATVGVRGIDLLLAQIEIMKAKGTPMDPKDDFKAAVEWGLAYAKLNKAVDDLLEFGSVPADFDEQLLELLREDTDQGQKVPKLNGGKAP